MPHGLCMFDAADRLILCNAAYASMYALPRALTQAGTPLSEILAYRARAGNAPKDIAAYFRETRATMSRGGVARVRIELEDGRSIQIGHNPMAAGGYVATHEDVTEAIRAEAQIQYMARHDALTGLPNRTFLRDKMEDGLARMRRGGRLAVLCLDLDDFKAVNDTLGHPKGDELLRRVSLRLEACLNDGDTAARLGGDEFVVLQEGIDKPERAGALSRRLIEAIGEPFELDGHQVVIGASVGIAFAPNDGDQVDTLLKNADMALYRAKSDGRGIYRFFEPAMDAQVKERRQLELDLRRALAMEEFELYYQPLVDAASEVITGFEALLRWRHPERGIVFPAEFVPLAEEIGLIVPLGEWVIRKACEQATSWPREVKVAVNLSCVQFKSRTLAHTVASALSRSGLSPLRLELEITESVLLAESETTLATLHQLRALGVRIAMDDFGTGYSSLSYLRSFPFDKIKIDRSFIRELDGTNDCVAIVKAVASLGHSLGMATTAEGVETAEQFRQVRAQGCTEVQGYYFSPPCPASEVVRLLGHKTAAVA
jgi:diguanylate cyclase (GGDEF)-like protein